MDDEFSKKIESGEYVQCGVDKAGEALYRSSQSARAEQDLASFHRVPVKPNSTAPPSNVRDDMVIIAQTSAN